MFFVSVCKYTKKMNIKAVLLQKAVFVPCQIVPSEAFATIVVRRLKMFFFDKKRNEYQKTNNILYLCKFILKEITIINH